MSRGSSAQASRSFHGGDDGQLRVASVSIEYPSPASPQRGLFVQRRLAALAEQADVHVVHLHPWFPWLRPRPDRDALHDGPETPAAVRPAMFYLPGVLKGLDGRWVERAVVPAVRALETDGPFDLIDAHFGYPEGVGCVLAARKLRRPVFITMRGLERPILAHRWRGPQLRTALERCAGIICVAGALKELAVSEGVDPGKIRVIPNAVDRWTFRPFDRDEARRALGVGPSARLVVAVGMLVAGKGHHLLVEAIARLREKDRGLRLAVIGGPAHEPAYPRELRALVGELGLSDAVLLAGPQPPEAVAAWLNAADLFCLPSYDEGCCNAVLEAMACGVPVVTTPVGDNAVHVAPPRRGLLVPVDDVDALAQAVEAALQSPWDRREIARYGEDYTWHEVARQTARFFEERMGGGMIPPPARALVADQDQT